MNSVTNCYCRSNEIRVMDQNKSMANIHQLLSVLYKNMYVWPGVICYKKNVTRKNRPIVFFYKIFVLKRCNCVEILTIYYEVFKFTRYSLLGLFIAIVVRFVYNSIRVQIAGIIFQRKTKQLSLKIIFNSQYGSAPEHGAPLKP